MIPMTDRMSKLAAMLEKQPDDVFLLYAMGMEHRKAGARTEAIEHFDRVIARDWGYCYAYHQKGQVYEEAGDAEAAKEAYRQGIAAATRKGDAHAGEEIAAALAMIE